MTIDDNSDPENHSSSNSFPTEKIIDDMFHDTTTDVFTEWFFSKTLTPERKLLFALFYRALIDAASGDRVEMRNAMKWWTSESIMPWTANWVLQELDLLERKSSIMDWIAFNHGRCRAVSGTFAKINHRTESFRRPKIMT